MSQIPPFGTGGIAIVGIGCRLPGNVNTPKQFVEFLESHGDAIREVPSDRWSIDLYYDSSPKALGKSYVKSAAFLEQDIYRFDPEPFGLSPREAERIDPQQRLLLEATWDAFEDAGIPVDCVRGTNTAVFVGGFTLDHQTLAYSPYNRNLIDSHTSVGTSMTVLSNRISYTFDLHGPSMTVDTACSSSLVAVHLACQSIMAGASDLAVVGGVNVMLSPTTFIAMCKGQFLAPDGRSKTFAASADGYGRGEGAGIVVLKRLENALKDGDRIYAVIRATGVNQDGKTDGLPMPNQLAQEQLCETVLRASGLHPADIGYVEAHGTGTRAGDRAETYALGNVYGRTHRTLPLLVGSVKTNIGHLEAAAGITGLIKASLSVYHRRIFPLRFLDVPNPEIPFDDLMLRPALSSAAWPLQGTAHAAVNAFGYGGTNAHVIISESPTSRPRVTQTVAISGATEDATIRLIPISAINRRALSAFANELRGHSHPGSWLERASTLARRRAHLSERAVVLASTEEEMNSELQKLAEGAPSRACVVGRSSRERRLLWVFTGMGPQWWRMGRDLYRTASVFRAAVEEAGAAFAEVAGWSILQEMLRDESSSRMLKNEIAQPANFVLQVGLVRLLQSLGVPGEGILGHSVGELAAAWAAECLTLREAAFIVYHRSRIQQKIAGRGAMLAVGAPADQIRDWLEDDVDIAAYNAPKSITLAGGLDALDRVQRRLTHEGIFNRRLSVEVAYHSAQMHSLESEFLSSLGTLAGKAPSVALYSTTIGKRVDHAIHDGAYWYANARHPVLLQQALDAAIHDGYNTFLEIGPHPVLAPSIHEIVADLGREGATFYSLKRREPEQATFCRTVAELHVHGVNLDWKKMYPEDALADLPHYCFQRERLWVESASSKDKRLGAEGATPLLVERDGGPNVRFRADLARPSLAYLNDHRIQGAVVFPAAGFIEAALGMSVIELGRNRSHVIEELQIHHALVLRRDAGPELLLDLHANRSIHFYARLDGERWQEHARGRLLDDGCYSTPSPLDLPRLQLALTNKEDVEGLYRRFASAGLEYGSQFRRIVSVQTGSTGLGTAAVLAHLRPDELELTLNGLHPTLLDCGLQAAMALIAASQGAVVPVAVDRIQLLNSTGTATWAYAELLDDVGGHQKMDVLFADERGVVLAELRGLSWRALEQATASDAERSKNWIYLDTWQPESWPEISALVPQRWALVGTARPFLDALRDTLLSHEIECHWLRSAQELAEGSYANVIFASVSDSTDPLGAKLCEQLCDLVQKLDQTECTLRVVTFGAHAISGERPRPAQTALSGFTRVVMTEYAALNCGMIDLSEEPSGDLEQVARWLGDNGIETEEEIAIRDRQLYVRRVQRGEIRPGRSQSIPASSFQDGAYALKRQGPRRTASYAFLPMERRPTTGTEVEIEVHALAVDRQLLLGREASYGRGDENAFLEMPVSVAGRVTAVGPEVTSIRPMQIVHGWAVGKVGSHVRMDEHSVSVARPGDAAVQIALYSDYLQACHCIRDLARLECHDTALIHVSSRSFAHACVQVARRTGARVLVTSESADDARGLQDAGAERVYSRRTLDFANGIRRDTEGRGVDVVVNTMRGTVGSKALELLRPGGRFVDIAAHSLEDRTLDFARVRFPSSIIRTYFDQLASAGADQYSKAARQLAHLLADSSLRTLPENDVVSARHLPESLAQANPHLAPDAVVADFTAHDALIEVAERRELFRPDRTYLVTGGLGGFGLATAAWAVEAGARSVVLASRRGVVDSAAQETIRTLRATGAVVEICALDVTQGESIDRVLTHVREHMSPLAGIFHSAMVLKDEPLATLAIASLRQVLLTKAGGAWLLHEKTRHEQLDYFVLYSSVSALIGNPHQASYAAANSFLDGLAHLRKSEGLPVTSVSLGAIGGAGVLTRNQQLEGHLSGLGIHAIPAPQALLTLGQVLRSGMTHVGIVDMDWETWIRRFPQTRWHRLKELVVSTDEGNRPLQAFCKELSSIEPEAREARVLDVVRQAIAGLLRMDDKALDVTASLRDFGVDSLMATELQLTLEQTVGVAFPTIELLAGLSVSDVANRVLRTFSESQRSRTSSRPTAPSQPRTAPPDWRDHFLSRICVQPPYFDLHDVKRDGDWVEALINPLPPSEYENELVSCAESARHLAILGSCAVSMLAPTGGKIYYPVHRAAYPLREERIVLGESSRRPLGRARVRARCTQFDSYKSQARAETELLDLDGVVVSKLLVDYHVIPEEQFSRLFRSHSERTRENAGANPYASWRPLPPPSYENEIVRVSLGRVDPSSCLGHFVSYPALPVSIMTRDTIQLIGQGIRHQRGGNGRKMSILGGSAVTYHFVFAHEEVSLKAWQLQEGAQPGCETWRCEIYGDGRLAAAIELVCQLTCKLNESATRSSDPHQESSGLVE